MQTSQTESTQSSIDLQDSLEVTSPYVPPTGGRSTRRRNVSNDEPVVMTTARRTTRKTAVKAQADAMETPAVAAQSSRRRVQIAPACLELDSQLEKCVEQKKDVLMTPAAVGATSRRRRAEETEKKVYSTRRSARLAVKSMPMLSGETELSNEELFAKDCEDQEVNQKEVSGVTGIFLFLILCFYLFHAFIFMLLFQWLMTKLYIFQLKMWRIEKNLSFPMNYVLKIVKIRR